MSKSPKGKWEMCHLQEFKEILCAGEEHGGVGTLRDEGRGAGRRLALVWEGFDSQMKQPFACCCDQVGLQIPFLILLLRPGTLREFKWLS